MRAQRSLAGRTQRAWATRRDLAAGERLPLTWSAAADLHLRWRPIAAPLECHSRPSGQRARCPFGLVERALRKMGTSELLTTALSRGCGAEIQEAWSAARGVHAYIWILCNFPQESLDWGIDWGLRERPTSCTDERRDRRRRINGRDAAWVDDTGLFFGVRMCGRTTASSGSAPRCCTHHRRDQTEEHPERPRPDSPESRTCVGPARGDSIPAQPAADGGYTHRSYRWPMRR